MVLDTIIIGAGAMGSSSAYWLSKYQDVALIEQFDLFHTQGSSHGQSRVIRKTYQQEYFADMMPHAYRLWKKVEQETSTSVFDMLGGLDVGREGNASIKQTLNTCEKVGLSHEVIDAATLRERHPAYAKVSDDYYAIYQPDTGILNASRAVDMFQQQASNQGAQIMHNTPVTDIKLLKDRVMVSTSRGSFEANHVVISAGSWINQLMNQLDYQLATQVWKLTFAYFKVTQPELYHPDKFPVFIHWGDTDDYGFPIHERSDYVKIAPHVNELIPKVATNDGINEPHPGLIRHLQQFIDETFTGLDISNYLSETCLYTMTENENFILDNLEDHPNATIAGGFSGHGFKFTPLIGKLVQQLVMGQEPDVSLDQFQLLHFLK